MYMSPNGECQLDLGEIGIIRVAAQVLDHEEGPILTHHISDDLLLIKQPGLIGKTDVYVYEYRLLYVKESKVRRTLFKGSLVQLEDWLHEKEFPEVIPDTPRAAPHVYDSDW